MSNMQNKDILLIVEELARVLKEAKRKKRKKRKKTSSSLLYYMDYAVSANDIGGDGGGD